MSENIAESRRNLHQNARKNRGPQKGVRKPRFLRSIYGVSFITVTLILCNFLWIYSGKGRLNKVVCRSQKQLQDDFSWKSHYSSNDSKPALDYRRVVSSGLKDVYLPIAMPNDTILYGSRFNKYDKEKVRFMTIGIASVWRKEKYLFQTLNSIIKQSSEEEKLDIYIVLLLADSDMDLREKRAKILFDYYKESIENGLLKIIQPPNSLYPSIDFTKIMRTYNDPVERVQWRTKQVLDFAFLFWFTWLEQQSHYYLVLEDDILSVKSFVSATKGFVAIHNHHRWVALQLSGFLGIGKILHCSDLNRLVNFLLLFYQEHPWDILLNKWIGLMMPGKPSSNIPTRRVPGLFQHIGIHSTLVNKIQRIKDNTFSLVKRKFSHVNPDADIVTTISQYKNFIAELAYSPAPGMFWGKPKPKDTFDIIFSQSLQLKRLYIATGNVLPDEKKKSTAVKDKLTFGHVEVAEKFIKMETSLKAICSPFELLKEFSNGVLDYEGFPEHFPNGVQCIRIVVGPKQKSWVAITEIAIFTMDEEHLNDTALPGKDVEAEVEFSKKSVPPIKIKPKIIIKAIN